MKNINSVKTQKQTITISSILVYQRFNDWVLSVAVAVTID